jgi:hypothetical protein
MGNIEIELNYPLVDNNFNEIEESRNKYLAAIVDVTQENPCVVNIILDKKEMAATALYFSLKGRLNFTYNVIFKNTENWTTFVYSFLKSSPNIASVIYE